MVTVSAEFFSKHTVPKFSAFSSVSLSIFTAVLVRFNWSRFELTTSSIHLEIVVKRALIAEGGHEPYTYVSSAYKCGINP